MHDRQKQHHLLRPGRAFQARRAAGHAAPAGPSEPPPPARLVVRHRPAGGQPFASAAVLLYLERRSPWSRSVIRAHRTCPRCVGSRFSVPSRPWIQNAARFSDAPPGGALLRQHSGSIPAIPGIVASGNAPANARAWAGGPRHAKCQVSLNCERRAHPWRAGIAGMLPEHCRDAAGMLPPAEIRRIRRITGEYTLIAYTYTGVPPGNCRGFTGDLPHHY